MFREYPRTIAILVAALLLKLSFISSAHIKVSKRSTNNGRPFHSPCHLNTEEHPVENRTLNKSLQVLKSQTLRSKYQAESLMSFFEENDQISNPAKSGHWMNQTNMTLEANTVTFARNEPYETFKTHYRLLSVLRMYVNQCWTTGSMATIDTDEEEEKRMKLREFESDIDSCMCSLSIALRSIGHETNNEVTGDVLNAKFLERASPLSRAINRTYMTLNDGFVLMKFLNIMYRTIEDS